MIIALQTLNDAYPVLAKLASWQTKNRTFAYRLGSKIWPAAQAAAKEIQQQVAELAKEHGGKQLPNGTISFEDAPERAEAKKAFEDAFEVFLRENTCELSHFDAFKLADLPTDFQQEQRRFDATSQSFISELLPVELTPAEYGLLDWLIVDADEPAPKAATANA